MVRTGRDATLASATPPTVSAMPSSSTGPRVSPKTGQAMSAVVGGTRKKRLATREAAPQRIRT
jgi:hypothetical protein